MRLTRIAHNKLLSILLVAAAPLLVRALLLPWFPIPAPRIHDEFSHLLVADTFANGRLVNPVHPLWVHFESMHIVVRPVYASIYPIAQGAVMSLGQVVTGIPWLGVWLSMGLMCGALCWMLQGWVPAKWALLGGILAAARFGVFSYWMNSYYGGAMAACAGALMLGALPRIVRRRRWRDAAPMGIGLVLLANSRPYEGLLFSLPIVVALLIWMVRTKAPVRPIVATLVVILAASGVGMGVYFMRFSGSPFVLPYQFFRTTFTIAPHFILQAPRPAPVFYHRATHDHYADAEVGAYLDARANRPPHGVIDKAKSYARFYVGPFLALPFVTLPWMWKRRRTRFLLLSGLLLAAGLLIEVWNAPHYAAPAMGLILLLIVESLRHLRQAPHGALAVGAVCVLSVLFPVVHGGIRVGDGRDRANIVEQLRSAGGQHLLVVRYQRRHNPGDEWVYNSADIDGSQVVWAREMDPGSNQKLLRYFAGRSAWLVEPDVRPVRVTQYDPAMLPDPPFRFVQLGAAAIEALRSPEEIKHKILSRVSTESSEPYHFSCDQWNYWFTAVTGVGAPDSPESCFPGGNRTQPIGFDAWFEWLKRQS